MPSLILIYDDDCKYCTGSANTVDRLSNEIIQIPLSSKLSQDFISAQFEDEIFTLISIDLEDEDVLLGEDALRSVNKSLTRSDSISRYVASKYKQISGITSFLQRRERSVQQYSGIQTLNEESKKIAEEMLQSN